MKDVQFAQPTGDGRIYYDMGGVKNPCVGCSVCCRHFRVSFYFGELNTQAGGHVPAEMAVQMSPFRACMKGTESGKGRCIALQNDGLCGIYPKRPSVCREFPVFMEDGSMNPDCLRLRALYGIAPAMLSGESEKEAEMALKGNVVETLYEPGTPG